MRDNGIMSTDDTPTVALEELYAEWLAKALQFAKDEKGLSHTAVGKLTGINRTSLSKAKLGPRTEGGRALKAPEVALISQVTGYPEPTHLPVANVEIMTDLIGLKMAVAAGIWREGSKTVVSGTLKVRELYEPAYEGLKQYGRLLEDSHADLYAPKGFYVICVDYSDANLALNDGQIVVVERLQHANSTPLIEVTVREVVRREGKWILDPLCSAPDLLEPIEYAGQTDTLRITDLVIGAWRPSQRV